VNFKVGMIDKLLILSCLIVFFASGCAIFTKTEGILTLKRYSDGQVQIQRYVDRQEKFFDKLVEDLKNDKLQPGISKRKFMRSYGVPILSRAGGDPGEEVLLYRYPTKYFNSDRVYAYFDQSGKLIRWEYKPVR